jgi:hypothetical protein
MHAYKLIPRFLFIQRVTGHRATGNQSVNCPSRFPPKNHKFGGGDAVQPAVIFLLPPQRLTSPCRAKLPRQYRRFRTAHHEAIPHPSHNSFTGLAGPRITALLILSIDQPLMAQPAILRLDPPK